MSGSASSHQIPDGVDVQIDAWARTRQGPEGRAPADRLAGSLVRARGRRAAGEAADGPRRASRAARPHAQPRVQHGRGRHQRLREAARDPGRRLPRAAEGQHARAGARLLAPGAPGRARRDRLRGSRRRPRSSCAASTSRPSARSPRGSASSARPSPTRARACATWASTSPGRWASAHDDRADREARPPRRAAGAGSARGRSAPRSGRGCRCSAPTAGSSPSWSTTSAGTRSPRCGGSSPTCASLKAMEQAKRAGELLAQRAARGRRRSLCIRPRRLQVPRSREGAGRRRPRGRPEVLSQTPFSTLTQWPETIA